MNNFSITIDNIQHIKKLELTLDLTKSGLMVIIGKNGVGKTMLFKGIQNLVTSNTFATTSNKYIYKADSQILYKINSGEYEYLFAYNEKVETLDYKGEVERFIVDNIFVELPIPFGKRFKQFQKIGEVDRDIRTSIVSKQYEVPNALIELLNYIYDTERFNNLKEITVKKEKYYAIALEDDYYIREDYLSSGEYFIINIYKLIQERCKLIAIDEIDISLDAMAQVRFVEKLRELSEEYQIKLLFSTHSLALIKTLKKDELFYMDLEDGICTFEKKSFNYIKSLLYGFQDYDKYILVEDVMTQKYIEYLLVDENIFPKYIIIPIGGDVQVVALMDKSHSQKIFDDSENVISILDGDKNHHAAYRDRSDIDFLPFKSIEKDLFDYYNDGSGFIDFSTGELRANNLQGEATSKKIYSMLIRRHIKSQHEIFKFLSDKKSFEVEQFKNILISFLNN